MAGYIYTISAERDALHVLEPGEVRAAVTQEEDAQCDEHQHAPPRQVA